MRVGLVCPYPWDVPGGVQAHVRDLAEALLAAGHEASVLTPTDDDDALPPYAVGAGRAVPVPYNGSVARLLLGPVSATRVRRWIRDNDFDVLHVHEPVAPSISLLACFLATGPLVGTFHTANPRSRALLAAQPALQPGLEKLRGRIAVSEAARRTIVEHLGGDAVLIPNGVSLARFAGTAGLPEALVGPRAGTITFLGRLDEPRKGLPVLLGALPELRERRPGARLLIGGPGDAGDLRRSVPKPLRGAVHIFGQVPDADKAAFYRSGELFCAPNLGQESFGIVLLEALASRVPVVASDLEAFRQVLDDGRAGRLFRTGDSAALAEALAGLLADPSEREQLTVAGLAVAERYDWRHVAAEIMTVYETVVEGAGLVGVDMESEADPQSG